MPTEPMTFRIVHHPALGSFVTMNQAADTSHNAVLAEQGDIIDVPFQFAGDGAATTDAPEEGVIDTVPETSRLHILRTLPARLQRPKTIDDERERIRHELALHIEASLQNMLLAELDSAMSANRRSTGTDSADPPEPDSADEHVYEGNPNHAKEQQFAPEIRVSKSTESGFTE